MEDFEKSVNELFDLSKNIIETHESRHLSLNSKKNPILARLEKYQKVFDKTEVEEHQTYFKNIYTKHKSQILRGPKRDNWIKNGKIVLSYGEDVGVRTDIKFHISSIYNTAIKIADEVEQELDGLPDVDQVDELTYPDQFLLHLYRIFFQLAKKSDQYKIEDHITFLEREAGITSTKSTSSNNSSNGDPMSGLFDMATGMMEKMGVNVPRENLPSQKDFGDILGKVINNPQTKSMIGNMMKDMQNTNNIGDMVNKLVSGLGSSGLDIPGLTPQRTTDNSNADDGPSIENIEAGNSDGGIREGEGVNSNGEGEGDTFKALPDVPSSSNSFPDDGEDFFVGQ